jgi:hypothetical protein
VPIQERAAKNIFTGLGQKSLYFNTVVFQYFNTWQGSEYELPEGDTIVLKHVGV